MSAAVLASALFVLLGQDAVARGELRKLAPLADELEVVVRRDGGNLMSRSAFAELQRWPGLPVLELRLPVTRVEAGQLRKLSRFAARVPANGLRDPSLKLLTPALVRVDAAPREVRLGARPCAHAQLAVLSDPREAAPSAGASAAGAASTGPTAADAAEQLQLDEGSSLDGCTLRWLNERVHPKASAPDR